MRPPTSTNSRSGNIVGSRACRASSTSRARWLKKTGEVRATTPSTRSRVMVAKAPGHSVGSRGSSRRSRTPSGPAAALVSRSCGVIKLMGSDRTAIREAPASASLRSWSRLAERSLPTLDSPVRFRPGRARLVTSPDATGSLTNVKTIGIVEVAAPAAFAARVPSTTITSG